MNVQELVNTERQPHLWMFFAVSLPLTIALVMGLYKGNRWWKRRIVRNRHNSDREAAYPG
jgi:hypothetical protein